MLIGGKTVLVVRSILSTGNTIQQRLFFVVVLRICTNWLASALILMQQLHFVHWNSDLYPSARQAAISKDGLAVIAVFLEASEDCPMLDSLETLSNLMSKIKFKGETQLIEKPLNILELIPQKRAYWTYLGSLTTPPLWETVTWIIFENPIKCRQEQARTENPCLNQ